MELAKHGNNSLVKFLGGLMLLTGTVHTYHDELLLDWPSVFSGDQSTSIIDSYTDGQAVVDGVSDPTLTLQGRKGISTGIKKVRYWMDDPWVSQTFQKRTRLATQLPSSTEATDQTALPVLEVLPAWKEDEDEEIKPKSLAMLAAKASDSSGYDSEFQLIDIPGIKPSGVYAGCYPSGTLDARTGLITTDGSSIVLIRAGWNGKEWTYTQDTIQQGMVPALLTEQDYYDAYNLDHYDGSPIFAVAEDGSVVRLDRDRDGVWTPVGLGKIEGLASPTGSCGLSQIDTWDPSGPLIWSSSAIYGSLDGLTLEDWTQDFQKFTQEEEEPNEN